jgi:RNA polymerase sigma-B factor
VTAAPPIGQLQLRGAANDAYDRTARNRLVEDHLPLVHAMAWRYGSRSDQHDDIVQVGTIGLIKAIDRFDPERGVELKTYAIAMIVGEIRRHLRDRSWAVHVPRSMKELNVRLTALIDQLHGSLGRSPTIAELAKAAGVQPAEVVEALEAGRAHNALSLSVPVGDDPDTVLGDTLADPRPVFGAADDRDFITRGLESLGKRERRIIELRYFDELTQSQIAAQIGISQIHVSRLITQSLEKIRFQADRELLPAFG